MICHRDLWLFLEASHGAVTHATMVELRLRVTVKAVQGNQVHLEWSETFGCLLEWWHDPLEFLSSFLLRAPPLELRQEHRESFTDESGKGTLISSGGGGYVAPLVLWCNPRCSSRVKMGMSGNFLSCCKSVTDPFELQEGRCDFSRDSAVEKGLISPARLASWFFSSCG